MGVFHYFLTTVLFTLNNTRILGITKVRAHDKILDKIRET